MKLAAIRSEGHPLSEDQGQRQNETGKIPRERKELANSERFGCQSREISVVLCIKITNVKIRFIFLIDDFFEVSSIFDKLYFREEFARQLKLSLSLY